MKDKRNCGMNNNYPVYPQGMMPMNMAPMGMPINNMNMGMGMGMPTPYQTGYNQGYTSNSLSSNTVEQQINSLEQQINRLEARVDRLENMNNTNSNKYNNSNYYMV